MLEVSRMGARKNPKRQSRKATARQAGKRAAQRNSPARKATGRSVKQGGRGGDTQSVGEVNRCRFRASNLAWLAEYLSHFFVHDTRRAASPLLCLKGMVARPTAFLNAAMVGDAAKSALETLLKSPLFRSADLFRGMARACVARIVDLGLKDVLIVQDTTSFNYSGHRAKKGFGPPGGPTNGFFCHGSLAVSPDGVPSGLVDSCRWLIERFHYTTKSGCKLEECQVRIYGRMIKVLAMYATVAGRYLWLAYITRARGDGPCTMALSNTEWRVLCRVCHRRTPPEEPVSLDEATRMIAVIGGRSGRKRDGAAGAEATWTGLTFPHAYVQGVTDAWMEHADAEAASTPVQPPRTPGNQRRAPNRALERPFVLPPPTGTTVTIPARH